MNTITMMANLEAYYGETYGPDNGILRIVVQEYLDTLTDPLRREIFQVVIKRVSRSYGKVPDVARFEEAMDEAYERMVTPELALIEQRVIPTEEERAEMLRMFDEAKKTPAGRMLLGILGSDNNGQ